MTAEQDWALQMLSTAHGYVGEDRAHNRDQISNFLALFDLPFAEGGTFVPFCAAGASWCAAKALAQIRSLPLDPATAVHTLKGLLPDINATHFKTSPSCGEIVTDAKHRGNWVSHDSVTPSGIKPGWLVLYDFKGDGVPDHIEIVDKAASDALHTVGFNTSNESNANGGAVALRQRPYHNILGYVKLY